MAAAISDAGFGKQTRPSHHDTVSQLIKIEECPMKLSRMVGVSAVIFSFLFGSQSASAAIWYDITGPYGSGGATVKVGELHIDESVCQGVSGGCSGIIGINFDRPEDPDYSFSFHIPGMTATYASADLLAAGYGVNGSGQIEINGILSDGQELLSSVADGDFTIAGFDVMYEAVAAPAPSSVPLPAALPLYGSALAAMGIFGWARRRRLRAATS